MKIISCKQLHVKHEYSSKGDNPVLERVTIFLKVCVKGRVWCSEVEVEAGGWEEEEITSFVD